jgi:hypothetical protein
MSTPNSIKMQKPFLNWNMLIERACTVYTINLLACYSDNTGTWLTNLPCHSFTDVSQIAQSAQCLAMGWTIRRLRFDPRQRQKDFFSSLCVHTGSGAHPASCTMGTGRCFPGAKARPGCDADHSTPSSTKIENWVEAIPPLPQVPPWRVVGQH